MPDERFEQIRLEAFHLPIDGHARFCLLHLPRQRESEGRTVLYVHPFGEEMNKSRRMAALQAHAFAHAGWTVLQVDLLGCGDSDGEFCDASWDRWVGDVAAAAAWLRERFGSTAWLWGLRAGCLVAADAARTMLPAPNLMFWQPVLSGSQHLQHFLRLRVAAQLMGSADVKGIDTRELRARFAHGHAVEIAGYQISPALALGLDAAALAPIPGSVRVAWIEVAATPDAALSPAVQTRADAWRRAGHQVETRAVAGQPFWQTQEIAECHALIDATLAVSIAAH